jgi:RNA polymerase sigma-70 factor (ECF subfamily)
VSPAVAFERVFREEFERRHASLVRYLARLTGDPAGAADLAQEAFVRLFSRGSMPDDAGAWLVTVAHNLLRNEQEQRHRRRRLLGRREGELTPSPAAPPPDAAVDVDDRRARVRAALSTLPERERRMLLLRCEGFSYREIGDTLGIHEASVGTLLARAKDAFRRALAARGEGGTGALD